MLLTILQSTNDFGVFGILTQYGVLGITTLGLWAFNLTKLNKPMWKDRPMPSSTEFADKSQRIKQVGYLKLIDGIQM